MAGSHWQNLFQAWSDLPKPVGVSPDVIEAVKTEVRGLRGRILLLA